MPDPVYIHGAGLVTSLGLGVPTVFAQMLAGARGIRPITRFPAADYAQAHAGELPADAEAALQERFPADSDPAMRFLKAAGLEALGRADGAAAADPELGLVLSTNFGLMETLEWAWRERIETGDMDEDTFRTQQDVVTLAAAYLGAGGPRAQLSLSCASGAAAVDLARRWLLAGRARRVLAISYDALTEYCWCGLSNLRTISSDTVRPFDTERSGTVFSEGAAAVLLSRDARPDAIAVLGSATNNNAFHLTAPTKEAEGSRRAMAAALAAAGCDGAAIELISAHATGTTANDSTEAAAIRNLCGPAADRIPVGAFKSQLGHMLGAAGMAEVVVTAAAMQRGLAPANASLRQQDPDCAVDVIRGEPRAGAFRTAITNSAGIGGNNASVVLGHADGGAATTAAPLLRPVRLAAAGWVLPGEVGHGDDLPACDPDALLAAAGALADFKVKPYLDSVKGYLDPCGAYTLAAAALCRSRHGADWRFPAAAGVVAVTRYGAAQSGFSFYRQFIEKGARFASPMIFPHGYSNTAANLVAIEFEIGGPHYVFDHADSLREAAWLATDLVARGEVQDLLFIVNEAGPDEARPDGWPLLPGAVCLHLSATQGRDWRPERLDSAADPSRGLVDLLLRAGLNG